MEKQKRLFIAVNLPEQVRQELGEFLEKIPTENWRKARKENLHITLCFLGQREKKEMEKIKEAMKKASNTEESDVEINGFGDFGGRVIWAGIEKGAEGLEQISNKIFSLLNIHNQRFHAHITLARSKGEKMEKAREIVEKLRKKEYRKTISVKSIDLMESILKKPSPEYKKIFQAILGKYPG